jgi:hypothetical protein
LALLGTAQRTGLSGVLSEALAPWRKPMSSHDPDKIVLDLAVALAVGGDCLADIGVLRAEPAVFGAVASDPTVSRLISALAADAPKAVASLAAARAAARNTAWAVAGDRSPDHGIDAEHPLVIDLDATLVTAHSDKESAAPTFKRGYGFHPLCAFVEDGATGTGEPLAILLRPGNAGSNTAADHKAVLADALAQLPWRPGYRVGRKVLVRADTAGGTHEFVHNLHARRLSYSVGSFLSDAAAAALDLIPEAAWTPAYNADGQVRDGAWGHRRARPVRLAAGHAGDRAERTPAPRRPAAVDRPRRAAADRVRDQHRPRATTRSGAAASPSRPLRGPHPQRQRHRAGQPSTARLRPKPDLVRPGATGHGADRVVADIGTAWPRRAPLGTQTTTAAAASPDTPD